MTDKDPETQTPAPKGGMKPTDKKIFIGLGILFVVMALAYGISLGPLPEPVADVDEAAVEEIEQAYNADGSEVAPAEETADSGEVSFDMATATRERTLGDTSAPIKITEHASLSCGHCGDFHKDTFPAFKAAYIDTGKAYAVFSDFPLNTPALHATMASRCVAEDRYFDFITDLFEHQEDWAFDNTYLTYLEAKAGEYGLDAAAFRQCVQSEELQNALLDRMKAVQAQYNVGSTPSFIVNNQVLIGGALPFDEFDKAIQDALAQIEAEGADPSAAPEPADEGE